MSVPLSQSKAAVYTCPHRASITGRIVPSRTVSPYAIASKVETAQIRFGNLVPHSPSVFATCVARRGIYGIGAVFWSAVRVFVAYATHSRASPYSDKLTEYCLHASMTQYPVSLSLHGSLPTRTLYHILGGLQGEVVG